MSRPSGSSTLEAGAVRTYHGRTVEDLIPKIQDDLGPDAIIVHRREGLTGGVAGFFQRPYVEIDAIPGGPRIDVYDEEPLPSPPLTAPPAISRARTPLQPAPAALQPASTQSQPIRTPFYEREPLQTGGAGRYLTGHLAELAQSSTGKAPISDTPEPSVAPQAQLEGTDPFARVLRRATSAQPNARARDAWRNLRPTDQDNGRSSLHPRP